MYQIVERSMETGAINKTYSGYETYEDAVFDMEVMEDNDDFWYEVVRQ